MTCRHQKGDPSCGSYNHYVTEAKELIAKVEPPKTPDADNYEIVDVKRVNAHLVLKVKYPNCTNCTYEGQKVMVYLNVTEAQVLRWRSIDPHFKDPKIVLKPSQAPAPAARFPASADGWQDALKYAASK